MARAKPIRKFILTQEMRDVFKNSPSEDTCQEQIEKMTGNYNIVGKMAIWLSIFRQSDSLGNFNSNSPRIRGRAGEMLTLYVIKKLQEDIPELKHSKVYHSFHYEGTEQDILFVTERCVYFIEVKSQRSDSITKMTSGAGSSGASQNEMHIERFDAFLKKRLRYIHDVPYEPYVVFAVSKAKKGERVKGTTLMLPVQKLYKQLAYSFKVKNQSCSVRDYDFLVNQIDNYIRTGEEKASEKQHRKRLGY